MTDLTKHIRPYNKTQSMRLDPEVYRYIETIRALHANDFVSPSTADIIRTVLKEYVSNLRENEKYKTNITAIEAEIFLKLEAAGINTTELKKSSMTSNND